MGSEKLGSSGTLSDQEAFLTLSPESSKEGLTRSYECNFCKRGFTNAQALGGHMNIHRKDKAKAKAKDKAKSKANQQNAFTDTFTASTKRSKEDHSVASSEPFNDQYCGFSLGVQTGDHRYQFTPSNPKFPWNLAAPQSDNHPLHDEHLRVNLDLGIGTSEMEDSNMGMTKVGPDDWFEDEVDLELRLGHYP